ncbi:substrate-binding domain-containing protein [Candidatus Bathyarchaeota archaeon]|nr:substrate-binding domain-containing protein [Candidatus Bathyarchaeota archaeon]MBS7631444.1 substrate-binding domain-containing protein [Candidatus Bathyarchaeota archaeon]
MKQKTLFLTFISIGIILISSSWYLFQPPKESLIVSTTTSLYETGLLDAIKSSFEAKYSGFNISFISQGTGKAIETAKRGDADMILVHDPGSEFTFLSEGYGVNRKIIAYNFFIIVGPKSDPAGVEGLTLLEALKKIYAQGLEGNALWVSRGDNSGTHSKEKALWKAAGLNLTRIKTEKVSGADNSWYLEAGAGMTSTLQLANQKGSYTLSDIGIFLKNSKKGNIQLKSFVEGGKEILNVYSAIVVNPQKVPQARFDKAMLFLKFLVSDEGQELFRTFGALELGQSIFKPWIPVSKTKSDPALIKWVEEYAFFNGAECPVQYRYNAGDLFS